MINIHPEVNKIKDTIIEIRRDIHKHPELSFQEFRTSNLIKEKLECLNINVQTGVGKTGVVGNIIGNDGPCIALRADMDALPIQETSDINYKSINNGIMHACGHDGHIAMLLGAAEVLSKIKHKINGSIRFIFQPAEEGQGGAQYMIDDGCLKNVDEIYGAHLWNYQQYGTIGVKYATNRVGKFTKTITLSTNADKRPVILTIKGEVKAPPKDEGAMPVKKNTGSPLERN